LEVIRFSSDWAPAEWAKFIAPGTPSSMEGSAMPLDQAVHEALDGDVEPDFSKANFSKPGVPKPDLQSRSFS
jgi:hypothetical protein